MIKIWLIELANPMPDLATHLGDHAKNIKPISASEPLPKAEPAAVLICADQLPEATAKLEQLRANEDLERCPIMILADYDQDTLALEAAYRAGADDVVPTTERSSLAARLDRQLHRSQILTQLQQQLDQERRHIRHMTWHDPLTGLANRQALQQFIAQDLEVTLRAYRNWEHSEEDTNPADDDLAFMFLEVDHFRYLNDQYGQAFGDQVLLAIRDCLKEVFRETDTIVRWGGKTFLVVSRKANRDSAGRLAERARLRINQCRVKTEEDSEVNLSASIGISFFPFLQSRPKAFTWQDVVNVARLARDSAKASGRNAWVALNAASAAESQLEYEPLKKNPMRQIANAALQVTTSFPDYHTLTWPPPV